MYVLQGFLLIPTPLLCMSLHILSIRDIQKEVYVTLGYEYRVISVFLYEFRNTALIAFSVKSYIHVFFLDITIDPEIIAVK